MYQVRHSADIQKN